MLSLPYYELHFVLLCVLSCPIVWYTCELPSSIIKGCVSSVKRHRSNSNQCGPTSEAQRGQAIGLVLHGRRSLVWGCLTVEASGMGIVG